MTFRDERLRKKARVTKISKKPEDSHLKCYRHVMRRLANTKKRRLWIRLLNEKEAVADPKLGEGIAHKRSGKLGSGGERICFATFQCAPFLSTCFTTVQSSYS